MSTSNFVQQSFDNTAWFYKKSLQQFKWYKKVLGTKCQVTRVKESEDYRDVFGSIYSSTVPDDSEVEKFNYVVLINMNDMHKLFQKSIDPLQFYDNENVLELGDILIFTRKLEEYKWKVTDIQTFSETDDVLRQYTITGLNEVTSLA